MLEENGHSNTGFGRDVARGEFNEEQESQLQKLKEEAMKAAAGKKLCERVERTKIRSESAN